jgi:hypothetical protein
VRVARRSAVVGLAVRSGYSPNTNRDPKDLRLMPGATPVQLSLYCLQFYAGQQRSADLRELLNENDALGCRDQLTSTGPASPSG